MIALSSEVARWATWMRAAGRPATTIDLRTRHVMLVLREVARPLREVTTEHMLDFLGSKLWAPNTRRSYRASLASFFSWAQAAGIRADNPAKLIPPVIVPRGLPRPTPEAIYRAAVMEADPRTRLMVQLAAMAGLRRGEISRVRADDVVDDLVGWSLRVRGKGGHQRLVPLPDELSVKLRATPAGWVFPSDKRTGPLTPAHVGVLVSRVLPDGWTCHTLRHRCATVAYSATRDLRAIQELLGHAKPETTALYTQVPVDAVRQAVTAAAY